MVQDSSIHRRLGLGVVEFRVLGAHEAFIQNRGSSTVGSRQDFAIISGHVGRSGFGHRSEVPGA